LILQNTVSRIYCTPVASLPIMMTPILLELIMSHLEAVKLDPRDRAAIEALITEFFDRIDRGRAERLGELFVPDGVVKALDIGVDVKGGQAISEFFAARTRGRGFPARHSWNSLVARPCPAKLPPSMGSMRF
jgi:SnoaL-like domain